MPYNESWNNPTCSVEPAPLGNTGTWGQVVQTSQSPLAPSPTFPLSGDFSKLAKDPSL